MSDPVKHDLELTVSALKAGPTDLGAAGGRLEIDRWTDRLAEADTPELQRIGTSLAELRAQLDSAEPDAGTVTRLMRELGQLSRTAAEQQGEGETRSRLTELGNLLVEGAAEVG